MHIEQRQLQIFVTAAVVIGAAVVSLICDFLRRKNEELRERVIELGGSPEKLAVAAGPAGFSESGDPAGKRELESGSRRKPIAPESRRAPMNPRRGNRQVAGSGRTAAGAAKMDWEAMLENSLVKVAAGSPEPGRRPETQPLKKENRKENKKEKKPVVSKIPAGYQDRAVLQTLIDSKEPVSGLVVSIGVNAPRPKDASMPEGVPALIESLIEPGDFACTYADDEFLLICPAQHGAAAQRRLTRIDQQLWDFQQRPAGGSASVFSWGGTEVSEMPVAEAIAAASERMRQTRRSRKMMMAGAATRARAAG